MRKPDLDTRIAVTGAGIICSIGRDKSEVWSSIVEARAGIAPPTLRLDLAAADCTLDYIPHAPRPLAMTRAISNTFGFGGSNISLLFERVL